MQDPGRRDGDDARPEPTDPRTGSAAAPADDDATSVLPSAASGAPDADPGLADGPDYDDDLLFDPLLSDEPIDLAAVRADDALIDALAGGDLGGTDDVLDPDDPLVAMLAAWAASARPDAEPAAAPAAVPPPDGPLLRPVAEAPGGGTPDVADTPPASPAAETDDPGPAEPHDLDLPTVRLAAPGSPTPAPAAPAPVPAAVAAAVVPLAGLLPRGLRRRTRPPGPALPPGHPLRRAAVAVVVAALGISGAAASGGTALPGDPAWGISKVFFAERARSIEAAQVVSEGLERARLAISRRRPDVAARELAAISAALPIVREEEGHAQLVDQQRMLQAVVELTPPDPNLTTTTTPARPAVPGSPADPGTSVLAQEGAGTTDPPADDPAPEAVVPDPATEEPAASTDDPATDTTDPDTTDPDTTDPATDPATDGTDTETGTDTTGTTGTDTTDTGTDPTGTDTETDPTGTDPTDTGTDPTGTGTGTTDSDTTGTGTTGAGTTDPSTSTAPADPDAPAGTTDPPGTAPAGPGPAHTVRGAGTSRDTTTREDPGGSTPADTGATILGALEQAPAPVETEAAPSTTASDDEPDAPLTIAQGSAPAVPSSESSGTAATPDTPEQQADGDGPVHPLRETGVVPAPVNVETEVEVDAPAAADTPAADSPAGTDPAPANGRSRDEESTDGAEAADPEPVRVTVDEQGDAADTDGRSGPADGNRDDGNGADGDHSDGTHGDGTHGDGTHGDGTHGDGTHGGDLAGARVSAAVSIG